MHLLVRGEYEEEKSCQGAGSGAKEIKDMSHFGVVRICQRTLCRWDGMSLSAIPSNTPGESVVTPRLLLPTCEETCPKPISLQEIDRIRLPHGRWIRVSHSNTVADALATQFLAIHPSRRSLTKPPRIKPSQSTHASMSPGIWARRRRRKPSFLQDRLLDQLKILLIRDLCAVLRHWRVSPRVHVSTSVSHSPDAITARLDMLWDTAYMHSLSKIVKFCESVGICSPHGLLGVVHTCSKVSPVIKIETCLQTILRSTSNSICGICRSPTPC